MVLQVFPFLGHGFGIFSVMIFYLLYCIKNRRSVYPSGINEGEKCTQVIEFFRLFFEFPRNDAFLYKNQRARYGFFSVKVKAEGVCLFQMLTDRVIFWYLIFFQKNIGNTVFAIIATI